jgi:hypothetical protein
MLKINGGKLNFSTCFLSHLKELQSHKSGQWKYHFMNWYTELSKNFPEYKSKQANKNETLHNFSRSYFTLWKTVSKWQNQDTDMELKFNWFLEPARVSLRIVWTESLYTIPLNLVYKATTRFSSSQRNRMRSASSLLINLLLQWHFHFYVVLINFFPCCSFRITFPNLLFNSWSSSPSWLFYSQTDMKKHYLEFCLHSFFTYVHTILFCHINLSSKTYFLTVLKTSISAVDTLHIYLPWLTYIWVQK